MDTYTISAILVAVIATIPGIWALIYQSKKDKQDDIIISKVEIEREIYSNLHFRLAELEKVYRHETVNPLNNVKICRYCGKMNDEKNIYCDGCGAELYIK